MLGDDTSNHAHHPMVSASAPPSKSMNPSGSSIKLRGVVNVRNTNSQYHQQAQEGQALKQKIFSLPKDVNGVASITQARHEPIQVEYVQDGSANVVGPLILSQVVHQGKRHTSVEPNSHDGLGAGKNQGNIAMIPNGVNNGRVFRRQSSDQQASQ